jgi:hypothetical protein
LAIRVLLIFADKMADYMAVLKRGDGSEIPGNITNNSSIRIYLKTCMVQYLR